MRLGNITDVYPLIEKKLEEHYKEHGHDEIGIQVIRRMLKIEIEGPTEQGGSSDIKIKNTVKAFSRLAECKRFEIDIKSRLLEENIIEISYGDATGFDVSLLS